MPTMIPSTAPEARIAAEKARISGIVSSAASTPIVITVARSTRRSVAQRVAASGGSLRCASQRSSSLASTSVAAIAASANTMLFTWSDIRF